MRRIRAIKPRRAALFLAVAALAAAVACSGAREAGVGEPIEPLTLTLAAVSPICETKQAQEYGGVRQWQDSEGNWQWEDISNGWDDVAETRVKWIVSGGTAPYSLVIDGEARDAEQSYAGASGTASVSCALQFGETFIHDEAGRRYKEEPRVDSGLKTIRAIVSDAAGVTADASVNVYVILKLGGGTGDILRGGETYRLMGTLVTVPAELEYAEVGGFIEGGSDTLFGLGIAGRGWLLLRIGDLREFDRSTRSTTAGDGDVAVGESERELDALLDQLIDSVGRFPAVGGDSP